MINESLLKNEELAVYKLRSLYSKYGYTQYKMSKFEEYDLYVRNKDFLISDRVITFTDTNGKLLALKPDVTLSIINHLGNSEIEKLYYNENVYRVSGESHRFKEIMQTGLECVGNIGIYEIAEVTALAVKSLEMIDENYQLDISHAGFVEAILKENDFSEDLLKKIGEFIAIKNEGAVTKLLKDGYINEKQANVLYALMKNYSDISQIKIEITSPEAQKAFDEFKSVLDTLNGLKLDEKVSINFSLANNMRYYSGIVFKGYVKGIPTGVLSGGQYDSLMKKLKKNASAIGFAVYMDSFERLNVSAPEFDVDILLISQNEDPKTILECVEKLSQNGETVLVRKDIPEKLKYKKIIEIKEII